MQEAAVSLLSDWHTFYGIIGTSAATLTGLLFVVITLIAQLQIRVASPRDGTAVFNTPNIVHFGSALLVAALLSAPWQALWPAALLLGLAGLGGMTYSIIVLWRARYRLPDYELVLEDWLWHTALPLVSYLALVVAAILLLVNSVLALFMIGAATVLFLFIGIHNAWDNLTYIALMHSQRENTSQN